MSRRTTKKVPFVWKYRKGRFPRARWPKHAARFLRERLRREGNNLSAFYGGRVYLVGSALLDANEQPRDWDVRVIISDAEFQRRYGDPQAWIGEGHSGKWTRIRWRWSDDCVKQSQVASAACQVLVDVQVYPDCFEGIFTGKPRMRLDKRPPK